MKHIRQILFLSVAVFLYSCSSTNSLVNCPNFKQGKKATPKYAKSKKIKTKRHLVKLSKQERQTKRNVERITKKLEKVQQKLSGSFNMPGLEMTPSSHQKLYEVFDNFKANKDEKVLLADLKDWQQTELAKLPSIFKEEVGEITMADLPANTQLKSVANKIPIKQNYKFIPQGVYKKNNGLAIAGFVLSILSLFILGIPFGMLGVVFGGIGLDKISKNSETMKGKGFAIAAIIIGLLGIVGGLIVLSMVL